MRSFALIAILTLSACSGATMMDSLGIEGSDLRMTETELAQMETEMLEEGDPPVIAAMTSCMFRHASDEELRSVADVAFSAGPVADAKADAVIEGIMARPETQACVAERTTALTAQVAS
ncbi:hypothetical protein ACMA5I_01025 [Paracoccaceae bacterium GXU_MW_L88]